jgi:hypothetical protein
VVGVAAVEHLLHLRDYVCWELWVHSLVPLPAPVG